MQENRVRLGLTASGGDSLMRDSVLFVLASCGLAILSSRCASADRRRCKSARHVHHGDSASAGRLPAVDQDQAHETTGSGVVIGGKQILTNAHMVNYAAQVFIQPEGSSEKLPATVKAICRHRPGRNLHGRPIVL